MNSSLVNFSLSSYCPIDFHDLIISVCANFLGSKQFVILFKNENESGKKII